MKFENYDTQLPGDGVEKQEQKPKAPGHDNMSEQEKRVLRETLQNLMDNRE